MRTAPTAPAAALRAAALPVPSPPPAPRDAPATPAVVPVPPAPPAVPDGLLGEPDRHSCGASVVGRGAGVPVVASRGPTLKADPRFASGLVIHRVNVCCRTTAQLIGTDVSVHG
jgi:hypothetical protein